MGSPVSVCVGDGEDSDLCEEIMVCVGDGEDSDLQTLPPVQHRGHYN